MKIVIDTNILFSFFRENPVRDIIINYTLLGMDLFTPSNAIDELYENKEEICKYAKLNENDVGNLLNEISNFVNVVPLDFYIESSEYAKKISPDIKDSPFFALALKIGGSIWSNEPRLKKQSIIRVYSTKDLIKMIKGR